MNVALAWKEWREHRLVWLATACLAVMTVGGAYLTRLPGAAVAADPALRNLFFTALLILGVAYGLVCGGMMFAGEREAGTLPLLDVLAGRRFRVWRTKVAVGAALTVAQVAVLVSLVVVLGLANTASTSWDFAGLLLVLALDAFAAGLLASALCRTALGAAGLGALLVAIGWMLATMIAWAVAARLRANTGLHLVLLALLGGAAVALSGRTFCRVDRLRLPLPPVERVSRRRRQSGWRALFWLTLRQGWVLTVVLCGTALLFGAFVPFEGVLLWPVGTLLAGLACGSAIFAGEQGGPNQFLAAQRLPLGRVWAVKTFYWLAVAVLTAGVMFVGALAHLTFADWLRGVSHSRSSFLAWLRERNVLSVTAPAGLFLIYWSAYGFSVGLLCGQLIRKTVIALMVGLMVSAVLAALWVPSLVLGGLHYWQALGVPVILVVASRLVMRPWTADRLSARRPLLALLGCGVLALAWTAGGIWYRVVEVPDVGQPFDAQAIEASLPTPEQNEAGPLIRLALQDVDRQALLVSSKVGPPRSVAPFPDQLWLVCSMGWPPGKPELGRWLDLMFEGKWAKDAAQAAELPLGMVADPRRPPKTFVDRASATHKDRIDCLFVGRALQLQARGQDADGLHQLLVLLALSRQLRPYAVQPDGWQSEHTALQGFDLWLRQVGPKPALLRQALKGLSEHEDKVPSAQTLVQAWYLASRTIVRRFWSGPGRKGEFERHVVALAANAPWEEARTERLLNAISLAHQRLVDTPPWQLPTGVAGGRARQELDKDAAWAYFLGADLLGDVAPGLTLRQWGRLFRQADWPVLLSSTARFPAYESRNSQYAVRGRRLQVALALFQAEQGRPAKSLQDLVPRYLPALPVDPYTGRSFRYRISRGPKRGPTEGRLELTDLPAGLGVVWSDDWRGDRFLVPPWPKR